MVVAQPHLRDVLTRNGIPFEFHPDSQSGRRLIRDFGIDVQRASRPSAMTARSCMIRASPSWRPPQGSPPGLRRRSTTSPSSAPDRPVGGRRQRRLRGPAHPGRRALVDRRPGRQQLDDPQLPGLSRASAVPNSRTVPGSKPCCLGRVRVHATGSRTRGTRRPTADRLERGARQPAGGAHRGRCDLSPSGDPRPGPLVGMGVFYGAAGAEAPPWPGRKSTWSAGPTPPVRPPYLAGFAAHVTLLVREDSLAVGMSGYLITQLEATPNIDVRLRTRVVDGHGDRLEALTVEDVRTGQRNSSRPPPSSS